MQILLLSGTNQEINGASREEIAMAREELTTEQVLEKERAKLLGQQIGYAFLKRHVLDFDQSQESAKKIQDYLKQYNLEFSEESLEKAFMALTKEGVRFTTASVAAPVTAAPVEDALPGIPDWFPKMETNADIRAIPREKFKELYFGKAGEKFKARLEAVKKRGL